MKLKKIYENRLLLAMIVVLAACKKDKVSVNDGILQPMVEKLSRSYIQTGEKLSLYGKNLVQSGMLTEVTINGREAEILVRANDSIQVLVPAKVTTGKVAVTVSKGEMFKTGSGPDIEIKPTPLIKKIWPAYAYGGETITLSVENFSADAANNSISLNGTILPVTGGNGHDTLLVTLPANAQTGQLRYSTFAGPEQKMDSAFPVRQASYPVSTVGEWLQNDPGFRFSDTLLRGYPNMAGSNYEEYLAKMYLASLAYTNDASRTYTVFVPADQYYINRGYSFNGYVQAILDKPADYNAPLVSAIIPDVQLSLNDIHEGDSYNTPYTAELVFGGPPDMLVKRQFTEIDGNKYVFMVGPYGDTSPPVRILREHKVGNATIMEIDGDRGVIYF